MTSPVPESSLLAPLAAEYGVTSDQLTEACATGRRVAVLDDDPTGNQTIKDLPVITRWSPDDLRWALRQQTAAFFVLTNTRSLDPVAAEERTREAARACLAVAAEEGVELTFASRSDSTLRGHFPLEPETLAEESATAGQPVDAVIINPSYLDAGRLTVDGTHWVRTPDGMVPAGETEYASDATFGYRSSELAAWVEEKTAGRIPRDQVVTITVQDLRRDGPDGVTATLLGLTNHPRNDPVDVPSRIGPGPSTSSGHVTGAGPSTGSGRVAGADPSAGSGHGFGLSWVVTDAVADDDLRVLTLGLIAAERAGRRFAYRVGPSFVRSRSGQFPAPPVDDAELRPDPGTATAPGGLIIVGSHVPLSSRQLDRLTETTDATRLELDVDKIIDSTDPTHVAELAERAAAEFDHRHAVITTSRTLRRGLDGAQSLAISRAVSAAVVDLTKLIMERRRPAFVIAKGGITSSDVATEALGIRRATIRGTLLPGIVSLWQPAEGPAAGLPYVVFAGNVGTDDSLAEVVRRFDSARS
ncbi:four-carbon acid sugar kinase family protein [Microlunatus sp. GCM10028923]|uniref:four-carbon acid sugar kinase family protein n=1 Tax=Microlunatus sp. GCM10028923 TaxID=3273400 RepID=UPI003614F8A9